MTADATASVDAPSEPAASVAARRRSGSAPGWVVWSMVVLASLIAIGAGLNTWLKRQVLDTDTWVEASNEFLADDDIRGALSVYLVDELYANVDVADQLEEQLPEALKGLAGPITAALREPATQAVDRLLSTDRALAAWERANTVAHQTLVNILKDETRDGISTAEGVVTLQLGTLVADLGSQLGLPGSVLDRIPPEAGTIVVADSDELEGAQQAVEVIEVMSVLLFFVVLALYVAAVYFANDRRATLRNVGIALGVSGLILLIVRQVAIGAISGQVQSGEDVAAAVRAATVITTSIVRELAWTGLSVGVLIALYAVLVGPSRAMTAVRRGLAPLLANRFTVFVSAIVIVAVVAAVTPGSEVLTWYARLVLFVLLIVGIERLRTQVRREFPDATVGSVWSDAKRWFDGLGSTPGPADADAASEVLERTDA